jgi:hypothetical protein
MVAEADMGLTEQAMQDHNRYRGDESLYVKFFVAPVHNKVKSLEEGRPIFEDREMIMIAVPGDKSNIIEREVRDQDKQRFARQYRAWKEQHQAEFIEGTPLDRWAQISPSQVEELKHFHVRTVEQLAAMPDSTSQKFMGIQALKAKANQYLELSQEEAPVAKLQAELEERDNRISQLEETVEALQAKLEEEEDED